MSAETRTSRGRTNMKVDAITKFGVLFVLMRSSLIKILKLADVLEEVQRVSKTFISNTNGGFYFRDINILSV